MYGDKNETYTFDENDTFDTVLDHLSIKFNYNFYHHRKSMTLTFENDNYRSHLSIKNIDMKLKDLPCKDNILLCINISPRVLGHCLKEGYSRENKYQDENEEANI